MTDNINELWGKYMFNRSIEVDAGHHITFNSNITELEGIKRIIGSADFKENTLEININSISQENSHLFFESDMTTLNGIHLTLNLPFYIFKNVNMETVINNFIIKNIEVEKGLYQIKLFKKKNISDNIQLNNHEIYKKALLFEINSWEPNYNTLNESLKVSNNLLNELNQTLLDKKKLNKDLNTIKEIVDEL